MGSGADSSDEEAWALFTEPEGFYPAEKQPTFATHRTLSGIDINLRLVGHNPLWGHLLWNAGRTLAHYLERNATDLVQGRSILELGAGAALPALVCALFGAKDVVVTDYPDAELVENIRYNIDRRPSSERETPVTCQGHLWGASTSNLLQTPTLQAQGGFHLLILADLLFNHSEHAKLLRTVQHTLLRRPEAQALVFFTPYRPWLLEKDLAFFDLAREGGLVVEKVLESVMEKVMFEKDPGDELLRRTVFGYSLRWAPEQLW